MPERPDVPPLELFTVLRALDCEAPTSSATLAARLSMGEAVVAASFDALEAHGVPLVRGPGGAVRLGTAFDALAPEAVARALPPQVRRAFDLTVIDATGSTNADLREAAAALPSGHVLAAELQYAGRGRRGRGWTSPIGGGLTFSLLWKFSRGIAGLSGLSLAVGLATARAFGRCGAAGVMLKWPNDLLAPAPLGLAKLAGILIEITGSAEGPATAVIGIGINVRLGAARARIDQAATDLASLGFTQPRNALLAVILEELLATLRAFERDGFAPMIGDWNAQHAYQGRRVLVGAGDGAAYEARALGVDRNGALLLDTAEGERRVASGEVSLRPV